MLTLSLGAMCFFEPPSTWRGRMVKAAAAVAVLRRNSRRGKPAPGFFVSGMSSSPVGAAMSGDITRDGVGGLPAADA